MNESCDLSELSDQQISELLATASRVQAFRADIESRFLRVRAEVEGVEGVMKSRDPVAFEPIPVYGQAVGHPPGARVLYEDQVFVNTSGTWLTLPPHDCPALWALVDDEPAPDEPEGEGDANG